MDAALELIRAALLRYAEEELDWGVYGSYINYYDAMSKVYEVPGLGPVKIVDCHGIDSDKNYDGWSEDIWIVFEIQDKLYKATGTHTSYTGSEWQRDLKLVKPQNKTVIEYVEANEFDY